MSEDKGETARWEVRLVGGDFIPGEIIRGMNGELRILSVDEDARTFEAERVEGVSDSEYRAASMRDSEYRATYFERIGYRDYCAAAATGIATLPPDDALAAARHAHELAIELCALEDEAFDVPEDEEDDDESDDGSEIPDVPS